MNNDSDKWVYGVFYVNKEDSRFFVSKRLPFLGFTLNFGHKNFIWLALSCAMLLFLLVKSVEVIF